MKFSRDYFIHPKLGNVRELAYFFKEKSTKFVKDTLKFPI